MLGAITLVHVAISLIGIASGFGFAAGLLGSREQPGWTNVFLWSTIATSATGFLFPFERLLPSHIFGVISLVALGVALWARGTLRAPGGWRKTYVGTTLLALYLNTFVLVVQMFLKIPVLHDLAPTQSEPAFGAAQGATLAWFVWAGLRAAKRYQPELALRAA